MANPRFQLEGLLGRRVDVGRRGVVFEIAVDAFGQFGRCLNNASTLRK